MPPRRPKPHRPPTKRRRPSDAPPTPPWRDPAPPPLDPPSLDARTLFDRDGLWALDKPPGLASVGAHLHDPACLQYALLHRAQRMVWAVHQLDRDTSGVNLFVRRKPLVSTAAQALQRGAKLYLAVCRGAPAFDRLRIDAPIDTTPRDPRRPGARSIDPLHGRAARTDLLVLDRAPHASLILARIHTGRTHQVRLHLAHAGHPLLGDPLYDPHPPSPLTPTRHALHAWRALLRLDDAEVDLVAPLPNDLRALIDRLRLAAPDQPPCI